MRSLTVLIFVVIAFGCQSSIKEEKKSMSEIIQSQNVDTATFAGGCFWCVEASFEQIKGVYEVVSGYAGGKKSTADYKTVSSGNSKHAEAVQIYYDSNVIDYATLIEILFTAHDPTQLNRQGPDVGPQYRSAIFYNNQNEKGIAESKIKELQPNFSNDIVTELNLYTEFFIAEEYHQDYARRNPYQPYIVSVSQPKIRKVKQKFSHLLKEEYK